MLGARRSSSPSCAPVPGDPVEIMLGRVRDAADAAALRRDLGLDGPPPRSTSASSRDSRAATLGPLDHVSRARSRR
jgi:hypothetical protein